MVPETFEKLFLLVSSEGQHFYEMVFSGVFYYVIFSIRLQKKEKHFDEH